MAAEVFFLPVANGQRFCVFHPPFGTPRGCVLYLHPFAEEMNKSRRMAALQAEILAGHGYAVLFIDLHGCGDSSGDFGDATWSGWCSDTHAGIDYLRQRIDAPIWLWGLRVGCLIAAAAAKDRDETINFLFWNPSISGKQSLQQFLRLTLAGEMISGAAKGHMDNARAALAQGRSVEVAGYALSPALASGLEAAELLPPDRPGRLIWLEVGKFGATGLAPASGRCFESWRLAGFHAQTAVPPGLTFWQTSEITVVPALLDATLAMIESA